MEQDLIVKREGDNIIIDNILTENLTEAKDYLIYYIDDIYFYDIYYIDIQETINIDGTYKISTKLIDEALQ
jgi:hypothetical protein